MVVVVVPAAAGRLGVVVVVMVVVAGLVDVPGRGRDAGQDRLAHVGVDVRRRRAARDRGRPSRWARAWARSRRRRR